MTRSVLVIEGDGETRDALHDLLTASGASVSDAETGAAATVAVQRQPPALILIAPGPFLPDGDQFLEWLQAKPEFDRVPVIATAMHRRCSIHRRVLAVLDKPYVVDGLVTLVRAFCRLGRPGLGASPPP